MVHLRARCARRRLRALLPRTPLAVIQMACPMQVSYQGLQQLVRKLTAATVCCRHKLVMQARRQVASGGALQQHLAPFLLHIDGSGDMLHRRV